MSHRPNGLGRKTYSEIAFRPIEFRAQPADNVSMNISDHAKRQAASRLIPVEDVVSIALERMAGERAESWAILVGFTEDGFRGFSNGDVVWAIVRGDALATVMYRRQDQPSTPTAFGVERVVA